MVTGVPHGNSISTITSTKYAVRDLAHNLLGLPKITDLNLLVLVDAIHQSDRATLQQKFPSLFTGLGTLQNKYDIRLT